MPLLETEQEVLQLLSVPSFSLLLLHRRSLCSTRYIGIEACHIGHHPSLRLCVLVIASIPIDIGVGHLHRHMRLTCARLRVAVHGKIQSRLGAWRASVTKALGAWTTQGLKKLEQLFNIP